MDDAVLPERGASTPGAGKKPYRENQTEGSEHQTDNTRTASAVHANGQAQLIYDLELAFVEASGVEAPPHSTEEERKAATVRWVQPLAEIADAAGELAGELVVEAVRQSLAKGLELQSPLSISKAARGILGEWRLDGRLGGNGVSRA